MRNLFLIDAYRDTSRDVLRAYGNFGDDTCGVFAVPSVIDGHPLRVIASSGAGWEHVSVSRKNRCPNWPEMDQIKRLFFRDEECVMQLHVPAADHISDHPNCLHLWKPQDCEIPRPPGWMVGGISKKEAIRLCDEAMTARGE